MPQRIRIHKLSAVQFAVFAAMLALVAALAACGNQQKAEPAKEVQKTFASPEDASAALFDAAKSGDPAAMVVIFGPDNTQVLFSGDAVKDKGAREAFVDSYTKMHRWREIKSGGQMLYTGPDNFVFPIPLGQNPSGQWYFDTLAGKDEILARRIGKDELTAIAACTALADAQKQYFSKIREGAKGKQYALKLISDDGKQNGLYWPVADGKSPSPLEDVRNFATAAGYTNSGEKPKPFDGYYFRILTKQGAKAKGGAKDYLVNGNLTGGFAFLAYPAEYRNSGIMSFVVGADSIVYQKDLGEQTAQLGPSITEYDPGDGWTPAL